VRVSLGAGQSAAGGAGRDLPIPANLAVALIAITAAYLAAVEVAKRTASRR
jgi:hypothetical protein